MDRRHAVEGPGKGQVTAIPVMAGLFLALTAFLVMVLANAEPDPARGEAALQSLARASASLWLVQGGVLAPVPSEAARRKALLAEAFAAVGEVEDDAAGFGVRIHTEELFIDRSTGFRSDAGMIVERLAQDLSAHLPPNVIVVVEAGQDQALLGQGAVLVRRLTEAGFSPQRIVLAQRGEGLWLRFIANASAGGR